MHSVVNVENLQLFKLCLLDEREDATILPIVYDLVPNEQALKTLSLTRRRMTLTGEKTL